MSVTGQLKKMLWGIKALTLPPHPLHPGLPCMVLQVVHCTIMSGDRMSRTIIHPIFILKPSTWALPPPREKGNFSTWIKVFGHQTEHPLDSDHHKRPFSHSPRGDIWACGDFHPSLVAQPKAKWMSVCANAPSWPREPQGRRISGTHPSLVSELPFIEHWLSARHLAAYLAQSHLILRITLWDRTIILVLAWVTCSHLRAGKRKGQGLNVVCVTASLLVTLYCCEGSLELAAVFSCELGQWCQPQD